VRLCWVSNREDVVRPEDPVYFFSDAVIAIALTQLAIELVPPQAADEELGAHC